MDAGIEYWRCAIKSSKIQVGRLLKYVSESFSHSRMWEHAFDWKYTSNRDGSIKGFEGKSAKFPILVVQRVIGTGTSPFNRLREQILEEENVKLAKEKLGPDYKYIPKAVVDEEGVVWQLNDKMTLIADETYYNNQIQYFKKECEVRMLSQQNNIKNYFRRNIETENAKVMPDTKLIKSSEENIERCQKDIDYYSKELDRLKKARFRVWS